MSEFPAHRLIQAMHISAFTFAHDAITSSKRDGRQSAAARDRVHHPGSNREESGCHSPRPAPALCGGEARAGGASRRRRPDGTHAPPELGALAAGAGPHPRDVPVTGRGACEDHLPWVDTRRRGDITMVGRVVARWRARVRPDVHGRSGSGDRPGPPGGACAERSAQWAVALIASRARTAAG
jgi:hypothetical protein